MGTRVEAEARSPVEAVETGKPERVETGVALCLSGGGYRAMLFHVGAIWRLNEFGCLPTLERVSSWTSAARSRRPFSA